MPSGVQVNVDWTIASKQASKAPPIYICIGWLVIMENNPPVMCHSYLCRVGSFITGPACNGEST